MPLCAFSDWGKRFKEFVAPYGGFVSYVAFQALLHIAADVRVTTGRLESLHASLRRMLFTHGTQAQAVDLSFIASLWAMQRSRTRADLHHLAEVAPSFAPHTDNTSETDGSTKELYSPKPRAKKPMERIHSTASSGCCEG